MKRAFPSRLEVEVSCIRGGKYDVMISVMAGVERSHGRRNWIWHRVRGFGFIVKYQAFRSSIPCGRIPAIQIIHISSCFIHILPESQHREVVGVAVVALHLSNNNRWPLSIKLASVNGHHDRPVSRPSTTPFHFCGPATRTPSTYPTPPDPPESVIRLGSLLPQNSVSAQHDQREPTIF